MRFDNFRIGAINSTALQSTTIQSVVQFAETRDYSSNSLPIGTIENGGLAYTVEISTEARSFDSGFDDIWSDINNLKSPQITRVNIFNNYTVFELPDYGHQTMSYGMYDVVLNLSTISKNGGLGRIPRHCFIVIRSFVNKTAYILISKNFTFPVEEKIYVDVSYKRLEKTIYTSNGVSYTNNKLINMPYNNENGKYEVELTTLLGYVSDDYLYDFKFLIKENNEYIETYNSRLVNTIDITEMGDNELTSKQIDITIDNDFNSNGVDYFKLALKNRTNIDIESGISWYSKKKFKVAFDDIYMSEVELYLYIKDEMDIVYTNTTPSFLLDGHYDVYIPCNDDDTYKRVDSIPTSGNYEIVPRFNAIETIEVEYECTGTGSSSDIDNIRNIIKESYIAYPDSSSSIRIYNDNGNLVTSCTSGCKYTALVTYNVTTEDIMNYNGENSTPDTFVKGTATPKNLKYTVKTDLFLNDSDDSTDRDVFTLYDFDNNLFNNEIVIKNNGDCDIVTPKGTTEYEPNNFATINYVDFHIKNNETLEDMKLDKLTEQVTQLRKNIMKMVDRAEFDYTEHTSWDLVIPDDCWFMVLYFENNDVFNYTITDDNGEVLEYEVYCKLDDDNRFPLVNLTKGNTINITFFKHQKENKLKGYHLVR